MEQLHFADLHSVRNIFSFKRLPDDAFNVFDLSHLTLGNDHHGNTAFSGSSRTSATVGVGFDLIRQLLSDNVCNVICVNSTGSNIGRFQHLDLS